MDQRGSTYSERGTTILQPGRGQLLATRTTDFLPRHISIVARTGRRTEQLLLMTVSDRDRNVKVKMFGCVEVIVYGRPME